MNRTAYLIHFLGCAALLLSPPACLESAAAVQPVLTNAAQLRALPSNLAAAQQPVQLRATVTALNPSSVFLQDETGGTFINVQGEFPQLWPGDILEVRGVTYVGRFVTGIANASFQVVDHGPLPVALPSSFDDLLSARHHYERVQVSGIIRSVTAAPTASRTILNLAMGGRKLEVQVANPFQTNLSSVVDAEVRLEGLAAGYINNSRQLIAPQLLVSRLDDLHVERPALSEPFSLPLSSASELLSFSSAGISNHRVHLRGVVTHRQPGEAIFLRDNDRGLQVQTTQSGTVNPGDIVEIAGFPAMGAFSALLEDAQFRVVGHDEKPQGLPVTLDELLSGTNDANLISIEGQVLEVLNNPSESVLLVRSDDTVFPARLSKAALPVRKGSFVRLTGVCRVQDFRSAGGGFGVSPASIELLLRDPADVAIVSAQSWWTAQRLTAAAAVLLGLALAAFVWVVLLRKRLAEQTLVIRQKVQRETVLEERHRMAREMHDTLAQSFSGLGFQLDALSTGIPVEASGARKQLDTARQMVRQGQEDFRRSLLNLRAQELERGTLDEALRELARQITAGTGIEVRCEVRHAPRHLPEVVETNLLRIGQECLANAVRHGQPRRIHLELHACSESLRLRIADDGTGFNPAQLDHAANGHFGWKGIRERSSQINARVELQSQAGEGTVVTVTVPI